MLLQAISVPRWPALIWGLFLTSPVLTSPAPTLGPLDGRPTPTTATRVQTNSTDLAPTVTAVPTDIAPQQVQPLATSTSTMWGTKPEPTEPGAMKSYCVWRKKYDIWQVYLSTCK